MAAEYSTAAPPVTPTTSYLTTDHLGSPRVITDENGQVIARRDFMPFGEELGAGDGPRTEALKYSVTGSDNIRQRFTGYEKDDETGLDFAEARMYQNKHGRFTAPDPLLASANAANPQTFNRYTYTGNDPINYNDRSGLIWCSQGGSGNGVGDIDWHPGDKCDGGWDPLDLTQGYECNQTCSIRGKSYGAGTVLVFDAAGGHRVISQPPSGQPAVAQGQSVAGATAGVARQTAGAAAASGAGTSADGGFIPPPTAASGPALLPLCASDIPCTQGDAALPRLDGSNAQPLKTVELIASASETCSMVPGLGAPCGIIAAVVRGGQGDVRGAGENLLNAVPFVGLLRKVDKAVDVAERVKYIGTLDDLKDIPRS